MKLLLRLLLIAAVLAGVVAAAYQPAMRYWKERNRVKYRHAEVARGRIVSVVNSTGTIKPVISVSIGSFVSGPIKEVYVDFNDHVQKDELLARIDPRIYEANVARDRAALATALAEVNRTEALRQQAINNENRAKALQARNKDFISSTEMDQYKYNRLALEAQVNLAKAAVEQAEGNLRNSETNLEYTDIRSPVDGIVVESMVQPGQTLAASFQTPQLFILAPDMDKKMHVYASVDEADIGMLLLAQKEGKPVRFTVDSYPEDVFEGKIHQVRRSSTTTNNVVTYPVVVEAPNPEMKLFPGMTADLSFEVESRDDVVKIPNSALRFYPEREHVREEDRKLLDATEGPSDDEESTTDAILPAGEKAKANRARARRHVWIEEEGKLRAVEVFVGVNDHQFTEMRSGALKPGQKLVTGIEPKT
jgi:HlyD family secretion protein